MPTRRIALFSALTLLAGGAIAGAVIGSLGPQDKKIRPLASADTDTGIEILEARAFQLDEPYTHWWRKEHPEVQAGLILVLRADPELVRARQSAVPVLYVGNETAERCNHGDGGGNLVVLVPAAADAQGLVDLDLATTPIFFGAPALPERVDAGVIQAELTLAVNQGAGPAPLSRRAKTRSALEIVHARDRDELDLTIADLIEFYSPEEVDLVELLRMPETQ